MSRSKLTAHARGRLAGKAGHSLACNPFLTRDTQIDWLRGYLKTCAPDRRVLIERRLSTVKRLTPGGMPAIDEIQWGL